MARYPTGDALLAACRTGRGAIVIVEGESDEDDAWVLKQWFGAQAMRLAFIPQNGWREVVKAVAALRAELPHRAVYGLRDRDFTAEGGYAHWQEGVPEDGVFVTPRSCIESYLLEPAHWFSLIELLNRGELPEGWRSEEDVAAQLAHVVEDLLGACAFNRVVHEETGRWSEQPLLRHLSVPLPEAGGEAQQLERLAEWGRQRGAPGPLKRRHQEHLERLRALGLTDRLREVSGKDALRLFLRRLPQQRRGLPESYLTSLYVARCLAPPPDINAIIQRILDDAP